MRSRVSAEHLALDTQLLRGRGVQPAASTTQIRPEPLARAATALRPRRVSGRKASARRNRPESCVILAMVSARQTQPAEDHLAVDPPHTGTSVRKVAHL